MGSIGELNGAVSGYHLDSVGGREGERKTAVNLRK